MRTLAYWATLFVWLGLATSSPAEPFEVVATTSLLREVLQGVGGTRLRVTTLIPPASCPGHFDLRPHDVATIKRARAVFAHQFEQFVDRIDNLPSTSVRVVRVEVPGNWLVPTVYARAVEKVGQALCQIDPAGETVYQRNVQRLLRNIQRIDQRLQQQLRQSGVVNTPVIGSAMLEPLLRWMGLKVVATYGRSENLTPAQWQQVAQAARAEKVRLVIDNLQSGAQTALELSREIGAQHVVLSNFPGGIPHANSWESCLVENVRRVIEATKRSPPAK